MTRKRWADVRDAHPRTPEQETRSDALLTELQADLAEFEKLLDPVLDLDAGLADVRRRALADKHPEWFESDR